MIQNKWSGEKFHVDKCRLNGTTSKEIGAILNQMI